MLKKLMAMLPEVAGPTKKKLSFKEKLKWTGIILISFFILSMIPLFGLGQNALSQFEQLSIILGASFGSIISLGIGPIVTASIVLQLLSGSGIINIDQSSPEGKQFFQGLQKLLGIFFIVFEAIIYVMMGGLAPAANLVPATYSLVQFLLILQLFFGGMLILFMAEVVDKWGFGSGISIFIAAGVSQQIFIRAFSPLTTTGQFAFGSGLAPVGQMWVFFKSLINADLSGAALPFFAILFTILVFIIAVYAQAMKVDIPLSFGRIRGHGIRWPLKFIYTSNIPVILVAALMANFQLWARLLQNKAGETGIGHWISYNILGQFSGQAPISGLVYWTHAPNLVDAVINKYFTFDILLQSLVYIGFMVGGAVIFSIFWVQTAGMDAKSQANQILKSGLQMPGFRRDPRVLERVLKRYIGPLTIMGGATVGILAAIADLSGALSRGTGILLTVMIIYKLYEEIAQQHMMDMNPALRKMMQ
ncbi:preprotein translocase subunit SecY [Candidatus Woesearchaeota archaeon]|jgi:preprotein translocase subunit SecY|nr:preprotein translocase subunit SecY [Candidatus Woesearchaeota archaeon]MBT4835221.1 preprotein translocase subunit SecY [Candidatus Woesearchaeota archaeon]MBT6734904.1 preprotein translocase subunit SecY [Candidatus Woesearchaeota archaeon]MBT7169581.1 preprotein translocase subunit SecY [Candidatus Woesearchaeota archaeon]MBT7474539.1 preprotein translocase subunit SecY [Candidatus Woesearchaeota archaeon]